MDAFTRCDVCEMSPADTLYDGSPMCYDCRAAYAKTQAEMANMPKEPCIGCGAEVCEDALCRNVAEYAEEVVRRVEADEYEDGMTDAEADADTLRSCGWGTDEDYGYFGDD